MANGGRGHAQNEARHHREANQRTDYTLHRKHRFMFKGLPDLAGGPDAEGRATASNKPDNVQDDIASLPFKQAV